MEEINYKEDSSGFYKRDPGGILLFGRYFVLNKEYHLMRENHNEYEYPMDGWSWFDSEDEARTALGLPSREQEALDTLTPEEKAQLLGLLR
jgi:hypothetical protein